MNTKKSIFPLFAILLMVSACKKEDYNQAKQYSDSEAISQSVSTGWQQIDKWEEAGEGSLNVRFVSIDDANITTDVADNGLVLVFKKTGEAINALPFEESHGDNKDNNYWYHQVSAGNVLIAEDVYEKTANNDTHAFKYFIITTEKLESLASEGYTTESLLSLDYNAAQQLLSIK